MLREALIHFAHWPGGETTHLLGGLGTLMARRWRRVGPGKADEKFAALLERKQALIGAPAPNPRAVAAIDGRIAQLREQNYRQTAFSIRCSSRRSARAPVAFSR